MAFGALLLVLGGAVFDAFARLKTEDVSGRHLASRSPARDSRRRGRRRADEDEGSPRRRVRGEDGVPRTPQVLRVRRAGGRLRRGRAESGGPLLGTEEGGGAPGRLRRRAAALRDRGVRRAQLVRPRAGPASRGAFSAGVFSAGLRETPHGRRGEAGVFPRIPSKCGRRSGSDWPTRSISQALEVFYRRYCADEKLLSNWIRTTVEAALQDKELLNGVLSGVTIPCRPRRPRPIRSSRRRRDADRPWGRSRGDAAAAAATRTFGLDRRAPTNSERRVLG